MMSVKLVRRNSEIVPVEQRRIELQVREPQAGEVGVGLHDRFVFQPAGRNVLTY